jgi:hypothetical protein
VSCKTGSREDAIHALINVWLKDDTLSCGWCGTKFDATEPCCEQPFIASNADILRQFVKEIARQRDQQKNKYASTDDKSLRLAVSMPPSLLLFLERSFEKLYHEKLFSKEYDTTWFAKRFGKYFAVAKEI